MRSFINIVSLFIATIRPILATEVNIIKDQENIHESLLYEKGFIKELNNPKFNSIGTCYKLNPSLGDGYYWIYTYDNLFSIVIHDFYFYKDFYLESECSEYFSVSHYESVSGEELNPYRKLNTGCIRSYSSNPSNYQAIFHKNIPIRSIGIEFMPKYIDDFLVKKYSDEYINPRTALLDIDETNDFPEMVLLLHQLYNYHGTDISAKMFYEGKVFEAMSLIYERFKNQKCEFHNKIAQIDLDHLQNVVSYINDHYAFNLTLECLSKIACMGSTKLKKTFKEIYKCTITEFIQHRRIDQAEHLLMNTDLTIGQVANVVGYKSASRFAELFRKNTGLHPTEYRKISNGNKSI